MSSRIPAGGALLVAAALFLPACRSGADRTDAGDGGAGEVNVADTAAEEASAGKDTGSFVLKDVGFQTPESVLHDEAGDVYLVSNINGGPADRDDNGFISKVSPEGELIDLKWIDAQGGDDVTLHAPKGMAIVGDTLFVADIDSVRMFGRGTGQSYGARGVAGATFLNDMTAGPDGAVYVTDTGVRAGPAGLEPGGTAALYRFEPDSGEPVVLAKGDALGGPNGVAVDEQGPVVVTFGSGKILRVGADGQLQNLAAPPTGQLDGVVLLRPGGMIVTSWEGKSVYHITTGGEVHEIWTDIDSPADLGYDVGRKRMLVPSFNGNFVEVRTTH